MYVDVEFDALESSQEEDYRYWRDAGDDNADTDREYPARIVGVLGFTLKVLKKKCENDTDRETD